MSDLTPGNDFILGVNYWPRRKAMYWWNNFDAGEVREEFSVIREIGLKVVRIFLLWDDFQPDPNSVSKEALNNLADRRRYCRREQPWARCHLLHGSHERTKLEPALAAGRRTALQRRQRVYSGYCEQGKACAAGLLQHVPP